MNDKTRADILDRVADFIGTDPLEGMHNWIKDPNFKGLKPPEWLHNGGAICKTLQ